VGTEYKLIKLDKGEIFDLGKGFSSLFPMSPFLLRQHDATAGELATRLEACMTEGYSSAECFLYAGRVANRLWEWAKWDRLIYITDNELVAYQVENCWHFIIERYDAAFINAVGLTETGTRYETSTSQ
jgi:hypothetical protein